jgi:hypothetical protein
MMNLNPPVSVIIFEFMSRSDPHRSLIIWQIVSAILYIGVIALLGMTYQKNVRPALLIWALSLAGFWHTLVLGQVYILLLLFTVLGWVFLRQGKYVPAGIAIGLVVAIKPNFILWPIFLLFSGYFITFLLAVLSALIVSLIPALLYGPQIYGQWLEASAIHPETLIMPGNNSILGLIARFSPLTVGIAISVVVVITLLVLSRQDIGDALEKSEYVSALGIIASLLASPISWTGYTILLIPVFFSLKRWSFPAILSAAILAIPFQMVLLFFQTSFASFIIFGWMYGWGILALLWGLGDMFILGKRSFAA